MANRFLGNGADWAKSTGSQWAKAWALFLAVMAMFATVGAAKVRAADAAEAAGKPPLGIGIFLSSRSDVCFDPGDVAAIKSLTSAQVERINLRGGIAGRKVRLDYFDDRREAPRAIANMRTALADPDMIGLVGLSNADRAKGVFDALGSQIKGSGLPFLSDLSLNTLFAELPNVYTTRASQDDERMPVLLQFLKVGGYIRPAFIGVKDQLFSTSLGDGLKTRLGATALVGDHRLTMTNDTLDDADIAAALAQVKAATPDIVFLSVGGARTGAVLKAMIAAEVTPQIFLTGRIDGLPKEVLDAYPNSLFQVAFDRLPGVYDDRLRKAMALTPAAEWAFEGGKIDAAPGWKNGECKPRPEGVAPDVLSDANMRAAAIGTQYADMVGLIADAARSVPAGSDVAQIRASVLDALKGTYVSGQGIYQGQFDSWSFNPDSRAAARTPFIVWRPKGAKQTQLAPIQFVRLRNDALRTINTLYLDIDLMRAIRVEDGEKSFFAEFYLSIRDNGRGTGIEQVEFSNAFLDPRTNDRQITVRTLNAGGKSDAYPDDMKIYQVAGKFMFQPQFENYPFDGQRFSIDIRPRSGDAPFIIQPPPAGLRDRAVETDGWDVKDQYVGFDQDFVPAIDASSNARSVVPFYKASFVWLMNRQTTDYYLRVVVPLAFILIVAYLSIFISQAHFEAIVTIQVTALLSAVALYLALPQIAADSTTLSDRIFLFNYMALSLMIGISIMRMNRVVSARPWIMTGLWLVHVVAIPALVVAMAVHVHRASQAVLG